MIHMNLRAVGRLALDGKKEKFRIAFDGAHLDGAGKGLVLFGTALMMTI